MSASVSTRFLITCIVEPMWIAQMAVFLSRFCQWALSWRGQLMQYWIVKNDVVEAHSTVHIRTWLILNIHVPTMNYSKTFLPQWSSSVTERCITDEDLSKQQRTVVRHFVHKGFCQLQNSLVTDEDLRGRNVLLLFIVAMWMLTINWVLQYVYNSVSLYSINMVWSNDDVQCQHNNK